jgi:hypothetical protein
MGSNGFLSASRFDDATALMQSGKEYVNLSPALQDAYTAWTTLQLLDRFILLQTFPHC